MTTSHTNHQPRRPAGRPWAGTHGGHESPRPHAGSTSGALNGCRPADPVRDEAVMNCIRRSLASLTRLAGALPADGAAAPPALGHGTPPPTSCREGGAADWRRAPQFRSGSPR